MSEKFTDQGGAASSNPSAFKRWLTSKIMARIASPELLSKKRGKIEKLRIKNGAAHVVEYFHQIDDAYSCLAVQVLEGLVQAYNIELKVHLVIGPTGNNSPEPELLKKLSITDSAKVAPYYGFNFPLNAVLPSAETIQLASGIFAALPLSARASGLLEISNAVWFDDGSTLNGLKGKYGCANDLEAKAVVDAGTARRGELKHYSGGMFYYGGEWYWGVDRLYHLENRLIGLGVKNPSIKNLLVPRPEISVGSKKDNGSLTLEIYPSLRSPYSSFIFDKAIELVKDSGVNMVIRPVMPMVMRGVALSRTKGKYIFGDSGREAHALGIDWGKKTYDPIGRPVLRAFSLYPWAREQGREVEFLQSFFRAAFFDGVNTNKDKGMKTVVENAGLSWIDALKIIDNTDWHAELEANRLAMVEFGSWGVPSFRLLDGNGKEIIGTWGQDRLWLVAKEIEKQIGLQ